MYITHFYFPNLHLRRSNAALQAEIDMCERYVETFFETASEMEMATVRIFFRWF